VRLAVGDPTHEQCTSNAQGMPDYCFCEDPGGFHPAYWYESNGLEGVMLPLIKLQFRSHHSPIPVSCKPVLKRAVSAVYLQLKLFAMAKQTGPILFEGTISNITGYQLNGKYFLKQKSAISKRRFKRDPRLANTRRNAAWFGQAVEYAKRVYYELSIDQRDQRKVWYPLRNRAQQLVRKGMGADEILRLLREEFILLIKNPKPPKPVPVKQPVVQAPVIETLPNEIILGRTVNPAVELVLIDQLAASAAFIRTILERRSKSSPILHFPIIELA